MIGFGITLILIFSTLVSKALQDKALDIYTGYISPPKDEISAQVQYNVVLQQPEEEKHI